MCRWKNKGDVGDLVRANATSVTRDLLTLDLHINRSEKHKFNTITSQAAKEEFDTCDVTGSSFAAPGCVRGCQKVKHAGCFLGLF